MNYLRTWSAPAFCQLHVHHGGGLIKLIIHPLLFSSFHLCNHLKEKKKKNSPACQFCSPSLKSVLQPWHGSDISLGSRLRLEMKSKNKKDLITVVSDHHKNVSQTKEKVRPNAILVIYLYNRRRTVQIPQLTFCLTWSLKTSLRLMETDMPRKKIIIIKIKS